MLAEHKTITMVSEVVKLTLHATRVDADCTFVFKNNGPACNVNTGFPDAGGSSYPFLTFQSFVDGKPVATKLEADKDGWKHWRVKVVPFEKDGVRIVREVYTSEMGGGLGKPIVAIANYILRTGASWHGPIGSAKIVLNVLPETEVPVPLQIAYTSSSMSYTEAQLQDLWNKGWIAAMGPCQPRVDGRSIVFEKQNWKPTAKDDIFVIFKYGKNALSQSERESRAPVKKAQKDE